MAKIQIYLNYKERNNYNIPEIVNIYDDNNSSYILTKIINTEEELIKNIDANSISNLDLLVVSKYTKGEAEANNDNNLIIFSDSDDAERYPYGDLFDMIAPGQEIYIFKRVKIQEDGYLIEKVFNEYINKEFYLYTKDINYFTNSSNTKDILDLTEYDFYINDENKIEISILDFRKYLDELDIKDDGIITLGYKSEI